MKREALIKEIEAGIQKADMRLLRLIYYFLCGAKEGK